MTETGRPFRPETMVAIEAVSRTRTLTQGNPCAGDVMAKDGRDLVTAVDLAVEDSIRRTLVEELTFPVMGEERGGGAPPDGSPYWLVDPICGTRNFASAVPLYCVNLALVERGAITIGVVGNPVAGEIYVAELGGGSWKLKNACRQRLTTCDDTRTVVIEDGKATGDRRERAARFAAAAIRSDRWDFRSFGTTLASPYVAAGRASAYVVFLVSAVHAGAGSLLITEAGGVVSDLAGRPWTIDSDSLVGSANRRLHDELLDLARASEA